MPAINKPGGHQKDYDEPRKSWVSPEPTRNQTQDPQADQQTSAQAVKMAILVVLTWSWNLWRSVVPSQHGAGKGSISRCCSHEPPLGIFTCHASNMAIGRGPCTNLPITAYYTWWFSIYSYVCVPQGKRKFRAREWQSFFLNPSSLPRITPQPTMVLQVMEKHRNHAGFVED